MNKAIKKITAIMIGAAVFSSIVPGEYLNIFKTKAFAAIGSSVSAGDIEISSNEVLYLYSGSNLKSSDKLSSGDTLTPGTSYYTEASRSRVKIYLRGQDNNKVRIYKGTKVYENGNTIPIDDNDTTSLEVRVYANDYDSYTTSEQRSSSNYDKYTIKVKYETSDSDSSDDSDNSGSAYLYDIVTDYGDINFSKETRSYNINVPMDIDQIKIKAKPGNNDYDVTVGGVTVYEEDHWGRTVNLDKGENVVKIEVEDNHDNQRTYTLNINRGGTTDDTSKLKGVVGGIDNTQDPIYLDELVLDDGDTKLDFNHKISNYVIYYKEEFDSILIKAAPEDSDHVVRINDDRMTTDNYVKTMHLNKGKNVFQIQVDNSRDYSSDKDEYKKRVYTLTVYRGTSEGSDSTKNNADIKANQWINNNGRWQYNDMLGNSLKNMWFLDKGTGFWYYLDENGYMKTGWFQDSSGNWYYLYPSGAMAYNTSINGYKLGPNGAWTK